MVGRYCQNVSGSCLPASWLQNLTKSVLLRTVSILFLQILYKLDFISSASVLLQKFTFLRTYSFISAFCIGLVDERSLQH